MVKTPLVVPDAAFGEALIKVLDTNEFPLSVALWLKEDEDWTLLIGTPLYDDLGAKGAYLSLITALSADGPIALSDFPIRLEGHKHPLVKELRRMFRKTESVQGMRLGGQLIGGEWVKDAYVYRIK